MSLHPTPTRLRLLREIASSPTVQSYRHITLNGNGSTVTARCSEMERAGWIQLGGPDDQGMRRWIVTDAGREILAAHTPQGGAS